MASSLMSLPALRVLKAAGLRPAKLGAVSPALAPYLLRLPDAVFKIAAARMLAKQTGFELVLLHVTDPAVLHGHETPEHATSVDQILE